MTNFLTDVFCMSEQNDWTQQLTEMAALSILYFSGISEFTKKTFYR